MTPTPRRLIVVAALLTIGASSGRAQVASSGFLVRHDLEISASPPKVYEALIGQIGLWWNPQHTYSGDSKNLSIDARPGGCFCERLPHGGGVEHLRVIYLAP